MTEENNVPFAEMIQTGSQDKINLPPFLNKNQDENNQKMQENINEVGSERTQSEVPVNNINNQENNIFTQQSPSFTTNTTNFETPNFIPPVPPPQNTITDLNNKRSDRKYYIIDLFWAINPKINQGQLAQNEAHLALISFNITFNNLRVVFYNLTPTSFQGNVLFLSNCKKLIDGTIYPSSAYVILNFPELSNFPCIEQLIIQTGEDWQSQRPNVVVSKNAESMQIELRINEFVYVFQNYQYNMFLDACKFALNEGRLLHGHYNLVK